MNISSNANSDRAWEGPNWLTKLAISYKKDSSTIEKDKKK